MKTHELKTINPFFSDVWDELKSFEVRFNDRDYKVGDLLLLREFNPKALNKYLFREILCKVKYILDDLLYTKEGYVIMSISIIKKTERLH